MITPQEYFALHHAWIDASIMLVVVSVCKRWRNTIIFVVQIKTHNMLTHCIIHQLTIHSYNITSRMILILCTAEWTVYS